MADVPDLTKLLEGHPNDILIVANPDINCDDVDPTEGWSHREYFQVKWDGRPHRIAPGKIRKMPRWLALHFAKHLADHLLMKKEAKEGKTGYLNSPVERPKVLAQILKGVEEYFEEPPSLSEGEMVMQQVNNLNAEELPPSPLESKSSFGESVEISSSLDVGEVENPVLGKMIQNLSVEPHEENIQTTSEDVQTSEQPTPDKQEKNEEDDISLSRVWVMSKSELLELAKKWQMDVPPDIRRGDLLVMLTDHLRKMQKA